MYRCPQCHQELTQQRDRQGMYWQCDTCHGRAIAITVLRRQVTTSAANEIWQAMRTGHGTSGRNCPACAAPMTEVCSSAGNSTMRVDVCSRCMLVWFDEGEFAQLPENPVAKPTEPELPQAAKEALALAKVQSLAEARKREPDANTPDAWWKMLPALLGFPVEVENPTLSSVPWVTWLLTAVISLISLYVLLDAPHAIHTFGFIPAQAARYGGLTMLTCFFLHAGFMHLFGNMYFLVVFGDNIEDYLGKGRFLLLLFMATLAGSIAHFFASPSSAVPCVGASGGIAGLITFYTWAMPNTRFGLFVRWGWFSFPAYGMTIFWILLQVVGAWQQVAGFSHVSAFAHLGGALIGTLCWFVWQKPREDSYHAMCRLLDQPTKSQPPTPPAGR